MDICHGTAAVLKFDQTQEQNYTTGKSKPTSLVSVPIFRVTDQSTVKCHHFENCTFYKVLYGEQVRLARSVHLPYKPYDNRNFKLMALRALVYASLTIGPLTNFGLLFPVVCFIFVWPSFIGAVLFVIKVYFMRPLTFFSSNRLVVSITHSSTSPFSLQGRNIRFLRAAFNTTGEAFAAGDHHGNVFVFDLGKNR